MLAFGSPDQAGDRQLAARSVALLRVVLLPIVFAGDRLVAHPVVGTSQFDLIFAVACGYAVVVLALTWAGRGDRVPAGLLMACDLLLVGLLTYESGGAFSQLRGAFMAIPLAAAVLLSVRQTAVVASLSVLVYVLVAVVHPAARGSTPLDQVLAQGLYVLWTGGAAILLSSLLERRRRRIAGLAAARGRLVAQAVDAEERARKRLADDLHDHAIQNLLAARQDVAEAREGDAVALERAEHALGLALGQLRSAVRELHPYLLDHLGLPAALETIVYELAERSGCEITIDLDGATIGEDRLIASLARELVGNAVKHAAASRITVRLARERRSIVLEVSDDGCGFTPTEQLAALRDGHIGLASTRERVEALGGALAIDSTPSSGTRVRCEIPEVPARPAPVAIG
ncbi:MAG: sensor histidine kinase [Solirubrobacteraceae bacterium]